MNPRAEIRRLLELAYDGFHRSFFRDKDPVRLVHRYPRPEDQEVAGFLAAVLAYGNVATILQSVDRALTPLGDFPAERLRAGVPENPWPRFRHRFTTGEDLWILSQWLGSALRQSGSLENFFLESAPPPRPPMRELLSAFIRRFTSQPLRSPLEEAVRDRRERNLKYLLSDPARGSACKRLNLYLRWMVRADGEIDLGIWKRLTPAELMLPVDTHLLKTLRTLRWTQSRQANWRVVEAATARLRLYCPEDPVRYDFSLCHLSMEGERLRDYGRRREAAP